MNPVLQQLQAEAQRRFSGQPGSNVATQPNPSASQSVSPRPAAPSPMAAPQAMTPQSSAMPTSTDPFGGAAQMMNGSMPMKGGTKLESALIKRMNLYPPA